MKEYKLQIANAIIEAAASQRIVSLYATGTAMGYKHIKSQDCIDIMHAVLDKLPGYKAVKLVSPAQSDATASLWTTLHFIDRDVSFEDAAAEDCYGEN